MIQLEMEMTCGTCEKTGTADLGEYQGYSIIQNTHGWRFEARAWRCPEHTCENARPDGVTE